MLRSPEAFPTEAFRPTAAGYLSAEIAATIIGPAYAGRKVFQRVSAKPFKRAGVTVSQVGDYLRAVGRTGKVGGDPQDIANAVADTANLTFEADLDWRVYHSPTGFQVEGMTRFPSDGNSGHLPYFEHPTEKDPETGKPLKLRARLFVRRFIAA